MYRIAPLKLKSLAFPQAASCYEGWDSVWSQILQDFHHFFSILDTGFSTLQPPKAEKYSWSCSSSNDHLKLPSKVSQSPQSSMLTGPSLQPETNMITAWYKEHIWPLLQLQVTAGDSVNSSHVLFLLFYIYDTEYLVLGNRVTSFGLYHTASIRYSPYKWSKMEKLFETSSPIWPVTYRIHATKFKPYQNIKGEI